MPLGRKLVTVPFKSKATVINESNLISFSQACWGCKVTNPAKCTNKLNLGFCTEKRDDPEFNQRFTTLRFLAQVQCISSQDCLSTSLIHLPL